MRMLREQGFDRRGGEGEEAGMGQFERPQDGAGKPVRFLSEQPALENCRFCL